MSAVKDKQIIRTAEAAEILGVSQELLRKWRERKIGPKYIEYESGAIRYKRSAVEAYRDRSEREPDA